MIRRVPELLDRIRDIHAAIRDEVVGACERATVETLAEPVAHEGGDTIFAIDRVSERILLERFATLAEAWPCVLIAEGLGAGGSVTLPAGTDPDRAAIRIIIDPIDGTRALMYQKRPGWILTGVAPNLGAATGLEAIEAAVMTEIPLVKQHLSDSLRAIRGEGVQGERFDRLCGMTTSLTPQPSTARTVAGGFGAIARFFPGARDVLAAIEEEMLDDVLGVGQAGTGAAFEDQYISTGGQLYELIAGHDRWVADLRPLIEPVLRQRGKPAGLYCHPYDLCTELIAREAGVIVTDPGGRPLRAPLDVTTGIAWVGYANRAIAEQLQPALQAALSRHGLL